MESNETSLHQMFFFLMLTESEFLSKDLFCVQLTNRQNESTELKAQDIMQFRGWCDGAHPWLFKIKTMSASFNSFQLHGFALLVVVEKQNQKSPNPKWLELQHLQANQASPSWRPLLAQSLVWLESWAEKMWGNITAMMHGIAKFKPLKHPQNHSKPYPICSTLEILPEECTCPACCTVDRKISQDRFVFFAPTEFFNLHRPPQTWAWRHKGFRWEKQKLTQTKHLESTSLKTPCL